MVLSQLRQLSPLNMKQCSAAYKHSAKLSLHSQKYFVTLIIILKNIIPNEFAVEYE